MPPALLIRDARQLLTLRGPGGPRRGSALGDLHVIPNGAVLIRNGVVEDVGPGRRVENLAAARDAEEIEATGRVVMPAFVDLETSLAHAHPASEAMERLLANRDAKDATVKREVLAEAGKSLGRLSSNSLRRRTTRIMGDMARFGTGTVESRAGYALGEADLLKVLRVQGDHHAPVDLVSTLLLKREPDREPVEWVRWLTGHLLSKVRQRRLAKFIDFEYEGNAIPVPLVMRIFYAASELGFGLKIHSEFESGASAVPLALRCGTTSIGNVFHITSDEIQTLANSTTIAVFTPGLSLQSGLLEFPSCRKMLDAGVIPALATAYHPELSSGYNMHFTVMLACRLYGMTPEEAIVAATINAAYAVGGEAVIGSIECGKQADIQILNISDYREVAYYSGVDVVNKMVKRGRVADVDD